jgi:ketoreductase RED1
MMNDTHAEHEFRNVTVIGGGVIGISWTALFLAHGLQVTVSDPLPDVQDRVRAGMREIAPTLDQLGLPVAALEEQSSALTFEADTAAAVEAADVVQENAPEHLDVKQELWQAVERAAPAHTLFASSSSTLPASETAKGMQAPERLIVGHPFNPPHLVPLVEVVPSKTTDPAVVVSSCVNGARSNCGGSVCRQPSPRRSPTTSTGTRSRP